MLTRPPATGSLLFGGTTVTVSQLDGPHLLQTAIESILDDSQLSQDSKEKFSRYLKELKWSSFSENPNDRSWQVVLLTLNEMMAELTRKQVGSVLEDVFSRLVGGRQVKIRFDVDPEAASVLMDEPSGQGTSRSRLPTSSSTPAQSVNFTSPSFVRASARGINPDPRFTFETFVVGPSNQLAYHTALAVAKAPGQRFNPVLIHSASGMGKTHLLHAIAHFIRAQAPDTRIRFLTAEQFINAFIEGIQSDKPDQFRETFRYQCDVLLVDDVQFLSGKEETENEFFHTFNHLINSGKQIVLTSDRPPSEIKDLADRVRTRLAGGVVQPIRAPEFETRIAILRAKAKQDDIYLPDEVAQYLAQNIKNNVRQLEAALVNLAVHAKLSNTEISLELAREEFRFAEETQKASPPEILQAVAKVLDIRSNDIRGSSRTQTIVKARHVCMYLIKQLHPQFTLSQIGEQVGGRDHASVIHGLKRGESILTVEPELKKSIQEQIHNS